LILQDFESETGIRFSAILLNRIGKSGGEYVAPMRRRNINGGWPSRNL
jgi:hypothetical protein